MIKDSGNDYPTSHAKEADILERKAIALGWHIPPDKKQAIVDRQVEIATEAEDNRHASIAAKVLTSMNQQNVQLAISNVQSDEERLAPVDPADFVAAMRRTVPTR